VCSSDLAYSWLGTRAGEDVGSLLRRACALYSWPLSSQARLSLVQHTGVRKPLAAAEDKAVLLDEPALPLADAGVRAGEWLLARVPPPAPPAPAPAPAPAAAAVDAVALLRAYYSRALSPAEASALRVHAAFAAERAALAAGDFNLRDLPALLRKLRSVISSETRARFLLSSGGVVLDGPVGGAVCQAGTNILLALRGARVLCAKVGPCAAVRHEWEVSQAVHRGGAQPVPAVARALSYEDVAAERGLAALLLPLYPLTVAAAEAALPPGPSNARDDLALAVALSGLAAIAAFAAVGWAHGDIKPANMMLAAADAAAADCVLIDFGTARRHGEAFSEGSAFALTEERTASAGFDLVCLGATLAAVQHELLIRERGMTRASLLDDVIRERLAAAAGAAALLPPASLAAQRCLELGARGAGVSGDDLTALVAEVQAAAQRMRAGR
jgi:hypothetical protein